MDDSRIIELYWERSEAAITETSLKYGAYCRCIAYGILNNKEDAEECLNDTYLKAWNAMPPHRPNRLSAFLGKITRNLALDRFRQYNAAKRGAGQTALVLSELEACIPVSDPVVQAADEMILIESINQFLYGLPKIKRKVFMLRYWYVVSIKEIALQTGMSSGRTASMLFRLRNELKIHLEKEGITL